VFCISRLQFITVVDFKVIIKHSIHVSKANRKATNFGFEKRKLKVFISNRFRFRLGAGEVIRGWDQGVKGMRVGGKRQLTIPPSLAYGNQKLPDIPANSTLIFDVELKNVFN